MSIFKHVYLFTDDQAGNALKIFLALYKTLKCPMFYYKTDFLQDITIKGVVILKYFSTDKLPDFC